MFTLPPEETENFIRFTDYEHKLDKLFTWGLITETAKKKQMVKSFRYYGIGMTESCTCDVVGYIPYNEKENAPDTAVITIEGQLSKIMPAYLKEMQKNSFKPNSTENTEE